MAKTVDELRHTIRSCPIIDNHAHNLLRPQHLLASDFLTITTEAHSSALDDTPKSLAHIRAANQLRQLYALPKDADWSTILQKRLQLLSTDADALTKKCLEGTQTILIDDGLGSATDFESYDWHDKFVKSPCKRIVRIETVASSILAALHQQGKLPVGIAIADEEACSLAWVAFITAFEQAVIAAIEDDEVVGFKSVVCYRTGLDIEVGSDVDVTERGLRSFAKQFLPTCEAKAFRIEHKGMDDALVVSACKLIAASHEQSGRAKPLQFHTGLGDNDISLLKSNPACLQPLIEEFPTVPIVLLHSSYPYTREAGYLATVFKNVSLDIGEVFPMVSRHGQEAIVRQALELTPTSKILWSTDGHLQAETYWLANVQGRQAIEKVLVELVEHDDLTCLQAEDAVKDIFFRNSNQLYGLELKLPEPQRFEGGKGAMMANVPVLSQRSAAKGPGLSSTLQTYDFFFVQWLDWMGTLRARCIPSREFMRLMKEDKLRFGISRGNLGTLQNDTSTPVCVPVGQIYVRPDLASVKMMHQGELPGRSASVLASFEEEDGSPVDLCPRSCLVKTVRTVQEEFDIALLVGFEVEVSFCKRTHEDPDSPFQPLDRDHAWATFTDQQYVDTFPLMLEITQTLGRIGIPVQQMHSEAGAGQYEFVLPPLPPVEAVDTLVQARQAIQYTAAAHGLRATYHPQPFPGIGAASHANISLNSEKDAQILEKEQMSFMAAVLAHLPALCAFTMPEEASYRRVLDDSWTSGTWLSWGTHNRETPLRRVDNTDGLSSRWEVRCIDGIPNMYLVLHTLLRVALAGLRDGLEMKLQDCLSNPSRLSDEERAALGIVQKLPTSLQQSLAALHSNTVMKQAIGTHLVDHYLAMKEAEQEMLGHMSEKDCHVWLMERY